MASNQQSPGVQYQEKSVSLTTVGASLSVGGAAGVFQWGPVMYPMLISNEAELVATFGKPDDATYGSFFNAANFLAYTSAMWVVRAATVNKNATGDGSGILIKNFGDYETSYMDGQGNVGSFAARYPGTLGNGLIVSMADAGTFATWTYKALFSGTPGTSTYVGGKGGSNDELHVVVIDALGKFSGTPGTVLEKYEFVSKALDAKSYEGLTNYYPNVLRNMSQYVYWTDHPAGGTNWGNVSAVTAFTSLVDSVTVGYDFTYTLGGGTDDNDISSSSTKSAVKLAWDMLADSETYEISLFPVGPGSTEVAKYVLDNIGEVRKDALVTASLRTTEGGPVFKASSTRIADATTFATAMGNSTYHARDSGFKYMYDKYNDKYRWVTLDADIAGLCAKVDANQDTWFSPAGLTKGQIRGAIKLSWSPNKSERDELYKIAINPVVTFAADGTVLYGDKTGTMKQDAFSRINVRRLFLALEKSISRSARYQLFENNDAVTRQQFISSVEPFLRDIQGRNGIEAFKVVCDETNNTGQVIAANEFRGTILIKPKYSINFITLDFVAVGPNVSFEVAAGA